MSLFDPLLKALFIVGALVALYVIYRMAQTSRTDARQDPFRSAAAQLGFTFRAEAGFDPAMRAYRAMADGSEPRIANEMSGTRGGHAIRCFDFVSKVRRDERETLRTRSIVTTSVPSAWPTLTIEPETASDRIREELGRDEDVDFESQEFSDRFWVASPDRRFAYDIISGRMMEHLLASSIVHWEVRDGLLVAWADGAWSPQATPHMIDTVVGFLDRVPRHVWTREGPA